MNELPKVKVKIVNTDKEVELKTLEDIEEYLLEKYWGELDTPYLRSVIEKEAEELIKQIGWQ